MKKFSEQSGLSTIFFRTMEILFCRYKQYGPVKIYGGVDHRNREGTFMIKCRKLMADFESMDVRRYRLFAKRIRKILGSAAYTRFWDFPRSLELNYDDVFKTTPLDFSALLVCETTRARLHDMIPKRRRDADRICRICLQQEIMFREKMTGKTVTEKEYDALVRCKPWTSVLRKKLLRNSLDAVKNSR
jgi:hypothetical protein